VDTRRYQLGLSRRTLQLLQLKRDAHAARLLCNTPTNREAYREANRTAQAAVKRNVQDYARKQAAVASELLSKHRSREFSQHVKRMAGRSKPRAPIQVLRDKGGGMQHGREGVLRVFTEHFSALLGGGKALTPETQQEIEGMVRAVEASHGGVVAAAVCEEPTVAEVCKCIKALRNAATPGEDGIDAVLLKANPVMVSWLHRVVTVVWRSGHAPVAWKRALVIPLHKKGEHCVPGNYRGISLLSIPGKVYATILLHRVSATVEPQLHEAQCGFRPGRGTVDAMFVLRTVAAKCGEFQCCLAQAFIDLAKAYDTINRWALWKVLALYGVHPKLIALLQDLHVGTQAAVRMDGQVGPTFEVSEGVRQGCVIAPLLFNVFMDFVVKQALARMPPGCGVQMCVRQGGGVPEASGGTSFERIVMLLYADDMVLLSHDPHELVVMLHVMDDVALEYGMCINASKTEVMVGCGEPPPEVVLSGGPVKLSQEFKYLGSWMVAEGGVGREVEVRRARALGVFASFGKFWGNKHLRLGDKVAVYRACVVPHLVYGAEAWNFKAADIARLEVAHSSCLRRLMHAKRSEHHTLEHIRGECGCSSLALMVAHGVLRWWGHVARMPFARYPSVAMRLAPALGKRPRGRPRQPHKSTFESVLKSVGMQHIGGNWQDLAQDRVGWRRMVKESLIVAPEASKPLRVNPPRAAKNGHTL
jgi:hypothetical protein